MQRRAIGIVRVSKVNGRETVLPRQQEQRERIEAACKRDGLQLIDVKEELDVSGGTALENRAGLRSAIEAIESGVAQVLLAAYFDRLCRSLKVQAELVERVEQAGEDARGGRGPGHERLGRSMAFGDDARRGERVSA